MGKALQFIKDWMLPVAIVTGLTVCLCLHGLPGAERGETGFSGCSR